MSQLIPLEQAIEMTARFREQKENILAEAYQHHNILPRCESFDREVFDKILRQEGCTRIRLYYGMDDALRVHAIIVGVDNENRDMLPTQSQSQGDEFGIIEDGARCPDDCPPSSELNP